MQTFLPYPDFLESAKTLDMKRLGKQRVETMQLMKANVYGESRWGNHAAAKMWKGYEAALMLYQFCVVGVWLEKGYNDTCLQKTFDIFSDLPKERQSLEYPKWLGDADFHLSHRSNLLAKKPEHYGKLWDCPDDLAYIWPAGLISV